MRTDAGAPEHIAAHRAARDADLSNAAIPRRAPVAVRARRDMAQAARQARRSIGTSSF